ncbi:MAG TPA: hypothetical protein VME01_03505 [Solirubrobacteraceae bacterium]|nr:hypothetical protein [Solirubrobacteraceae bacterium]
MTYHIHIDRLTPPRAWVLSAAAILSVALTVAGCGSSSSAGVAHLSPGNGASPKGGSSQGVSAASSESGGSSPESKGQAIGQALIAYAKCVRSHGVPSFPDPDPGAGLHVGAETESSPAFKAAQAKCQKLMPDGGPPGSGSPPSAKTLAHWLKVSQCMRKHGVSAFPDPATSGPRKSGGGANGVEIAHEGAIFALPATIVQSPAFEQAAAACDFR